MARWSPRTPLETLKISLNRLDIRIQGKKDEIKELEEQKRQVEQAISALNNE
jgi:hypothetical protein